MALSIARARSGTPGRSGWADLGRSLRRSIREDWVVVLVTLIGVATRLTYLNLSEFKADEARASALAVAFLEGRALPLIGIPSSVGINNPAAFVYLLAIPYAVSRDPVVATGFVGLLGVVAAVLTYRFCRTYFDRRTAQVAALLYASAPWAVVYERKLQAQDVVPFFTLLWVMAVFALVQTGDPRQLVWVALWLALLVQLHFSALALIPLTALVVGPFLVQRFRDPSAQKWAAAAAGLTVLLWVPYGIFQVGHGGVDIQTLLQVLRHPSEVSFEPVGWLVDLASTNGYNGLTGEGFPQYAAHTLSFDGLYLVERDLFYLGLAGILARLIWTRTFRGGGWRFGLLLLWLAVPILVFLRHSTPLYPHYFLDVFPAQFIVMGLGCSWIEQWARTRTRAAGQAVLALLAVVVVALVASQVYGLVRVMSFIQVGDTLDAHGVPVGTEQQALDRAIVLNNGLAKPIYLVAGGDVYPGPFDFLAHGRVALKTIDDTDTFVLPANDAAPTIYLTTDPKQPAASFLQAAFADRRLSTIPYPGFTDGFDLYRLAPNDASRVLRVAALHPIGVSVSNGMRLLGYMAMPTAVAGKSFRLAIYWQVMSLAPPGEDYAFFVHLLGPQQRMIGQHDGLGYPPEEWKVGDTVVSWFDLSVDPNADPGTAWLEVGVYRRSDVGRLTLRFPNGSTSQQLLLGPITVSR
jgi:hypothetical protein